MSSTGPSQSPASRGRARATRRPGDFFVAGGPVAPDRECYIERPTDQALLERLRAGEYCHIIAPRFSGKSSLAASTSRKLRAAEGLAAVVDLSQLGGRDRASEVGRWYYGLAYRVLRDLRLKLDLQEWWQERMPLPPAQRLSEFFWEIVIGTTRATVTVFLDEIESIEQSDYATELFKIVRACHDARAGEPEYGRLSFVMLGSALPVGGAERAAHAATEISSRLELPDFSFEEARPLARGLGLPTGDAERALYRILYWTGGHPYLTQKLCQAVARNAVRIDSDESVDELVAARFLGPDVVTRESSMSRVLDRLDRAGKLARPALRLYRRIRRGRRPSYDPDNPRHELLRVCGLVTITAERRLVVRNRIYAEAFSHRWAREALPVQWRLVARVAGVLLLLAAVTWIYVEVLPRPHEQTLRVASVELDEAVDAWTMMRRIPGFGGRADRLLARVLARHSRMAQSWPEARQVDERLRQLPGLQSRADALLVEFWERRAVDAEAAQRRDAALLYRLRAFEAGPTADAGRLAALAAHDYARLQTVIRPAGVVQAAASAPGALSITTVSSGNILERWDASTGLPEAGSGMELLTEEFVALRRRLSLDGEGRVDSARVEIRIDHPRPEDLRIVLVAPGGRSVELPVSLAGILDERLVFEAGRVPALEALRGEQVPGTWLLEIEDRRRGEIGFFDGWTLVASPAAGHRAEDRPGNPLRITDPARSSAVRAALSPAASVVAALPRNPDARGVLRTWEVRSGRPLASVEVGAAARWVAFIDESSLLLLQETADGAASLQVLDARTAEVILGLAAEQGLAAGPALSPGGRYLAAAERGNGEAWIRELGSAREVFRQAFPGEATAVAVSPGGLRLAVADRDGVVRVWHATDGALSAEFSVDAAVASLAFDPSGRWLVGIAGDGRMRLWALSSPQEEVLLARPAARPGHFGFDAGGGRLVTLQGNGYEAWRLPGGSPYGPVLRHGSPPVSTPAEQGDAIGGRVMLAGDDRLIGGLGTRLLRVWQVAPGGDPAAWPRIPSVVALAPSGLQMAAGTADGRIVMRMRDAGAARFRLSGISGRETRHGNGVVALDFSADGTRLASVGGDGSVVLWDTATGEPVGGPFQHGDGRAARLAVGPSGRTLVIAGALGARAWDAQTGLPGAALGPGRVVSAVAFDPAGRRAFTGTPEGTVESWDVASGQRLWSDSMDAPVSRIAVSADGTRVAAAGDTGLVKAWGLGRTGRPLSFAAASAVTGLQFAPDGKTLLVQSADWMHRLGVSNDRLRIVESLLLPASVPPQGFRSASGDGSRLVLVAGPHAGTMLLLDFDRVTAPPGEWAEDLEAWQKKLKLRFADDGELQPLRPGDPVSGELAPLPDE